MRIVAPAFLLASLSLPAAAERPAPFQATLAEKSIAFRDLAACERALGPPAKAARERNAPRGTAFNRAAGHLTRCEMIDGEPLMVVYPIGTLPRERPGRS